LTLSTLQVRIFHSVTLLASSATLFTLTDALTNFSAFDRYLKKAEKVALAVPPSNLGRLTRTIDLFTKRGPTEALQKLKKSTKADLDVVEVNRSQIRG
jgi:hypothetical protein